MRKSKNKHLLEVQNAYAKGFRDGSREERAKAFSNGYEAGYTQGVIDSTKKAASVYELISIMNGKDE